MRDQPAVDDDWSRPGGGVCDWLRAGREEGPAVRLHLLHQPQQESGALWDVVVGPGGEPVVSDGTTLGAQLQTEARDRSTCDYSLHSAGLTSEHQ